MRQDTTAELDFPPNGTAWQTAVPDGKAELTVNAEAQTTVAEFGMYFFNLAMETSFCLIKFSSINSTLALSSIKRMILPFLDDSLQFSPLFDDSLQFSPLLDDSLQFSPDFLGKVTLIKQMII